MVNKIFYNEAFVTYCCMFLIYGNVRREKTRFVYKSIHVVNWLHNLSMKTNLPLELNNEKCNLNYKTITTSKIRKSKL